VQLAVYDLNGRLVRILADAYMQPGNYRATWDGRDAHGGLAANGIYICRLKTELHTLARKMLLIR
jgi:flagellar hook assembly protein FlgD